MTLNMHTPSCSLVHYLPCTVSGAHSRVCVVYPVISSTSGLKSSLFRAFVMFRGCPVLATYPATPLSMGNLHIEYLLMVKKGRESALARCMASSGNIDSCQIYIANHLLSRALMC